MAISSFLIRLLFLAIPGILGSKLYKKLRGRPQREMWETFLEILIFSVTAYGIVHLAGCDRSLDAGHPVVIRAVPPFSVQSADPIRFVGPPSFSLPATQPIEIRPQPNQPNQPVEFLAARAVKIQAGQPVSVEGSASEIVADQTITVQPDIAADPTQSVFEASFDEHIPIGGYVRTICYATGVALLLALVGSYVHNFGIINWCARKVRASRRAGDEDAWTYFNNSDEVQWVFVRDFEHDRVYYGAVKNFSDSDKIKEVVLSDVQVYSITDDKLLYCLEGVFISRDHDNWTIEVPLQQSYNGRIEHLRRKGHGKRNK